MIYCYNVIKKAALAVFTDIALIARKAALAVFTDIALIARKITCLQNVTNKEIRIRIVLSIFFLNYGYLLFCHCHLQMIVWLNIYTTLKYHMSIFNSEFDMKVGHDLLNTQYNKD